MAGGTKHKFHHIYDYSEFQAQPPLDQTVFEVMKFISLLLVSKVENISEREKERENECLHNSLCVSFTSIKDIRYVHMSII